MDTTTLKDIRYDKEFIIGLKEYIREKNPVKPKYANAEKVIDLIEENGLDVIDKYCESPIEKQVGFALFTMARMLGLFVSVLSPSQYNKMFMNEDELFGTELGLAKYFHASELLIVPNLPLKCGDKKYRADFLVVHLPKGKRKHRFTLLECDSFQYHSTAKQLEKDKIRERNIRGAGFEMLRFSGAEITKNPSAVAGEILDRCIYGKK